MDEVIMCGLCLLMVVGWVATLVAGVVMLITFR